MIKKLVLKLLMLFLLGMSVNAAWAQAVPVYFASLKAQSSPASAGSGLVKLTWLDITGKPMEIDLAKNINYAAFGDASFMSKDYVFDDFGETAQLLGATMCAMDGLEQAAEMQEQIYMTSYVYFHAEAEPAAGSYFADWTFTDPQITRMNSSMNPADPMGDGSEDRPYRSPCFKVLPDTVNNALSTNNEAISTMAYTVANTQGKYCNLYAVFKKYLLSNPTATSGQLEALEGETTTLNVSVDVEGDITQFKENYADFVFPSLPGTAFSEDEYGTWSWNVASTPTEIISPTKIRAFVEVTYTAKAAITAGQHNTTITISMAGENPSTLNVNLSVNALDPDRAEAFWFDGETEKTSGDLSDMLAVNISGYTKPILKLNKPVATDLTFSGKDFTLDLNGNETQAITVSSGNVTFAYSKFGGEATSLNVTGGKAILNGGTFGSLSIGANGTVEQNGATITGAAINNGTLTTNEGVFNSGLSSSKTLIVNNGTFNGETAITVSGGTATLNRGTIEGTDCGLKVTAGTATVKKLAAIKGGTNSVLADDGTVNIECGKFEGALSAVTTFTSGYFKMKTDAENVKNDKEWMQLTNGVEYNEGYRYFLGTAETAVSNGVGVCRIGNVSYAKLEDAIAYANNNPTVQNIVIFMTNNYTLPAGYYTLPANATIVVPMSDEQAKEVNMTAPRVVFNDANRENTYIEPTEFRRLTFANGVNMNVFGQIEMTCSQFASNEAYTAQPYGPYGHLVMEEGCHLTLQSGSEVRAWGFVTGKGEMDARRGAKVREMFQLGDWKGALTSVKIVGMAPIVGDNSDKKIFPVTQYFIQNIESPVKYHPGAVLSTSAAVSEGLGIMSVSMAATDIAIVGVSGQHQAIFLMDQMADAENTWVRKWYDSENDIQVYDINSAAHIGSMVLDMGELFVPLANIGTVPIRLNSANFDLPLTCNFKIHLLSGTMDFKQNTSLLPGAEVEVDKGAIVTVAKDDNDPEHTGALYVYDADDWDKYAYCNEWNGEAMDSREAYTKTVRYAPSWNGRPNVRDEQTCPPDAAINVHGTFMTATGFVYCSEHGANIFSNNEDAGTFIFNESAEDAGERQVNNVKGSGGFEERTFYPAKLKNGVADPAYANTNEADAGDAYCYQNDVWSTMVVDEDNPCFMVEQNINGNTYYAKPQEYVAVVGTKTQIGTDEDTSEAIYAIVGNADHTYSDADGAGRLFILLPDACQWWEVEKKDNLYHCIHPNNDTYYEWISDVDPDTDIDYGYWAEKRYTITWKNWDGTEIISYDHSGGEDNLAPIDYSVTYGTMAEFLGTNPTRPANIDYTYDFAGWTPALGPVTSDVTYTATYTPKPRKYTIIFCQEGGVEIERQFLTHNEVPVCENVPTKVGHTLEWSPAIAAVVSDATYTATWLEEPPTEYEVTFYDYDGTTELQKTNVAVGALPTPPADPAGKPASASGEFTYVFDHWAPALEAVSATSAKSYTAVYREVAREYTISYFKEDGVTPNTTKASESLPYGATPTPPVVTKENPVTGHTYTLVWKTLDETGGIQTVMGDASYKPTYLDVLNKYSVTVKSNPSGACSISGNGLYDYGSTATIYLDTVAGFIFNGWSDGFDKGTPTGIRYSRSINVANDSNLVANFTMEDPDVTITWMNEAGTQTLATVGQKANTATIFTGATPTKDPTAEKTYTFYGWTTRDNEGHNIDTIKNGMTPKATANATYYAYFSETPRKYTISWKNEAGTADIEVDYEQPYGATIEYNSATPTKNADADYSYTFDGWSETQGGAVVSLPATVRDDAAFYAHFSKTPVLPTNLILGAAGSADLAKAEVKKNDLVITSNGINSAELKGADNLTLTGNAIFRMEKNFAAQTWYAVAVPWTVALSGIRDKNGNAFAANSLYVLEFDANAYATADREGGRNDYWHFLHQNGHDMQPGKLYMIWFKYAQTAVQFYKKAGETIWNTEVSVTTTTGEGAQSNWNAIANPALYHADLAVTVDDAGQDVLRYNGNDSYILGSTSNMIVGEPVFVQVAAPQPVVASLAGSAHPAPAYHRAPKAATDAQSRFVVELIGNGQLADRLIVQTAEEKANEYVIGKDLAKMGVSTKMAQMWMERYDTKLCKNTVEMYGEYVHYPLTISAPVAGEYTITVSQAVVTDNEYALYLTYNDEAIWNLSEADYTLNLNKGIDANYGLRISARKTPTGIDEAVVNAQGEIKKVFIHNNVFIIRGENVYSVDGQLVK